MDDDKFIVSEATLEQRASVWSRNSRYSFLERLKEERLMRLGLWTLEEIRNRIELILIIFSKTEL